MSSNSAAVLYGKGIFTTIAIRAGAPLFWEKHWRRLTSDAAKVGVVLAEYTEASVRQLLGDTLAAQGVSDGKARITFCDERPGIVWPGPQPEHPAGIHIIAGPLMPRPPRFRATVSPYTVNSQSPLAGVKSCNYMENILAGNEARSRGFTEAIRLNERGHVAGGTMSNVFWLVGGALFTPSLATGCLPGTTREFVLENLECSEVEAGIDELKTADAIYLTSAGLGIATVAEYNGRKLHSAPHPIAQILTNNY